MSIATIQRGSLRLLDHHKIDRLLSSETSTFDNASAADWPLDNLEDLIDIETSLGEVVISETLMCAKCVGECQIF